MAVPIDPRPGSQDAVSGRLPLARNLFVGREAHVRAAVRAIALPGRRLITIAGRSGVGKTRLALEVAQRVAGSFPGGVALLELSVPDHRPVADRLADALGARAAGPQGGAESLDRRLRATPILVIADDVDTSPGALAELLGLITTPGSRVLATAQRPTRHPDELPVRLRPLSTPPAVATATAARTAPAVALYVARASDADPEFRITDDDLPLIAELCRRLDGLPLAIELGAARASVLSPSEQLSALETGDPLGLTAVRGDPRPRRHRDLRSAIAATWELLSPADRQVLRAMSIFAAPPTFEHVQAVAAEPIAADDALLEVLGALVDAGLVEREERERGVSRFRLLPTIRAYGLEQLRLAEEDDTVGYRYDQALLAHARRTRSLPASRGARALARESVDLAVVLERLEAAGRIEEAVELASDLVTLWLHIGASGSNRATYARLLQAADGPGVTISPGILARGLVGAVALAVNEPTVADARTQIDAWLRRGGDLARASEDGHALLAVLEWEAFAGMVVLGDPTRAAAANAEGLALAAELDEPVALTRFLYRSSMFAAHAGDLAASVAQGATALRAARASDDPEGILRTAIHLSWMPRDLPGLPPDLPSLEEQLEIARTNELLFEEGILYPWLALERLDLGDARGAAGWCATGLAFATRYGAWVAGAGASAALIVVANALGDGVLAARLLGVLSPMLPETLSGMPAPTLARFEAAVAASRERLGETRFITEQSEVSMLDRDAGLEWAAAAAHTLAAEPATGPSRAAWSGPPLTPRERAVLAELAQGGTNREIGRRLGMAEKTVMHHSVSIYGKLGVRGRVEASAWAIRQGLVPDATD